MMDTLPIQASELVPLTTRLLPKELSHAFGIADDTYDSNAEHAPGRAAAAPAPVITSVAITNAQAGSNVAAAQQKRSAPEATARQPAAAMPAQTVSGAASKGQYAAVTQALAVSTPQPAPVHPSSVMQGPSVSQQQATSSISAGLQQQPALQATAAVVGGHLRGLPAAYISPHPLLPYGQQAVAALPHLSGALPVAMYSPADISAVMALQQQQQQQQQQHDEAAEELQARALKRPRLVWTPQLHKLFEEAVQKIGVNKAVPKTIMQMMNIEGLTRENVASHLQKYRLSLKKGPDGEFITTVTEGTETSAADGAGSAGGTAGGAAAATATADAGTTAGNNTSSEAAGDSVGAAAAGAAGAAAGGGERSDAGTRAVAGSRGDAGTEAGSNPAAAAAAAAAGSGSGGVGTGPAGPLAQEPKTAAAVAAATEALAAAAAAEGLGPSQAGAGDAGQAAGAAAGGPAAVADS